ncbi:hypothetical protein [Haloferula sp. A504]|uniref:hypothetical protein n=1 Tax=Haloferula sp. A504 TaxID=3373601 RepID=UPI0031C0B2CE|nr:hypothetical protein [Verrucomicrobiaceae bacterium E54]
MIERWMTMMLVLLAAGCAGPGNAVPPVVREARERADDGHDAFAEGRIEEATLAYGEALSRYRSIDDPVGIVRSLVNIAVVRNASGARSDASDCLDAVDRYVATLSPGEIDGELNELRAEAAWMRAYLELDAGRRGSAWRELERGRALGPPRGMRGRFDNLEARLRLEEGDAAGALSVARRAAGINRRAGERAETADSHRLGGRAALATGDAVAAQAAFESALAIDRDLARPGKVADDLEGLADAARAMGQAGTASAFDERARLARRAAGE